MNDDQAPSWISRNRGWLWIGAAALSCVVFVGGVAAQAPASLLAGRLPIDAPTYRLSGKLHTGRLVTENGDELVWRMHPLASLATASLAGGWTFDAPDAALSGDIALTHEVKLSNVAGRVGSRFLTQNAPGLGEDCVFTAEISAERVVISTGTLDVAGGFTTSAGKCNARDLPALAGSATSEDGVAVLRIQTIDAGPDEPALAVVRFAADGSGRVDLTAKGSEVLAGREASGPSSIELLK